MKVFVAAVLILLLLTGGVCVNGVFLHNRLGALVDAALLLPDAVDADAAQYAEAIDALHPLWDETRPITMITVSALRIEHIDRAIGDLQTAWETGDDTAYRQARGELILQLRRLRDIESCSISAVV
ncbi:MAG: DUF4363 family protein [Clostridia bacterium]|nr:DUF4363 family protein [Clostridia bacterium]